MKKVHLIGLLIILGCSRSNSTKEVYIKDYYFPYLDFVKEQIYQYININDSTDRSTWIMQTQIKNGDTLFMTKLFNSENELSSSMTEKIDTKSSIMRDYKVYTYDNIKNQTLRNCKIIDSIVYNWTQKIDESIIWKVTQKEFTNEAIDKITKTRTLFQIDSANKIVIFKDKMNIDNTGTGKTLNWLIETTYQKGIGLVRYKIYMADGFMKEYKLTSIKK